MLSQRTCNFILNDYQKTLHKLDICLRHKRAEQIFLAEVMRKRCVIQPKTNVREKERHEQEDEQSQKKQILDT